MTQTHPTPTNQRLDNAATALRGHIGAAREFVAAIDPRTRRSIAATVLFIGGLMVAVLSATTVFSFWTAQAGPVVWDAAHGNRDAITTVCAFLAAAIVFVLLVRAFAQTAANLANDAPAARSGASGGGGHGGPVPGAMAGTSIGAMVGGQDRGSVIGAPAPGASAGGAAGLMRPPRSAGKPATDGEPADSRDGDAAEDTGA